MRRSGDAASCSAWRCWWMWRSSRLSGRVWVISAARLARTALVTGMPDWEKRSCWPCAFGGVLLLQGRADLAVVAFDGGEGLVGEAVGQQGGGDA